MVVSNKLRDYSTPKKLITCVLYYIYVCHVQYHTIHTCTYIHVNMCVVHTCSRRYMTYIHVLPATDQISLLFAFPPVVDHESRFLSTFVLLSGAL